MAGYSSKKVRRSLLSRFKTPGPNWPNFMAYKWWFTTYWLGWSSKCQGWIFGVLSWHQVPSCPNPYQTVQQRTTFPQERKSKLEKSKAVLRPEALAKIEDSNRFPPKGSEEEGKWDPLFQFISGILGWWNISVWPDQLWHTLEKEVKIDGGWLFTMVFLLGSFLLTFLLKNLRGKWDGRPKLKGCWSQPQKTVTRWGVRWEFIRKKTKVNPNPRVGRVIRFFVKVGLPSNGQT